MSQPKKSKKRGKPSEQPKNFLIPSLPLLGWRVFIVLRRLALMSPGVVSANALPEALALS